MALAAVGLYFKPDTRCVRGSTVVVLSLKTKFSITTWALKEAKARMEARGEATDYVSYKAAREAALTQNTGSAPS